VLSSKKTKFLYLIIDFASCRHWAVCAIFVFCKLKISLKECDFHFIKDSQSNVTTMLSRFLENGILCRGVEADCMYSRKENAVKLTTNEKLFSFSQNQSGCLTVRCF